MIGKLDDALRFNESALKLREQRQQLLASNIVNGDTPNYKARDIEFTKALQGAMAKPSTTQAATLSTTSAAHIAHGAGAAKTVASGAPLLYRTNAQGNIDGNTVDMDVERNQFTDNAIRFEASITAVTAQIKGLLSVIQG